MISRNSCLVYLMVTTGVKNNDFNKIMMDQSINWLFHELVQQEVVSQTSINNTLYICSFHLSSKPSSSNVIGNLKNSKKPKNMEQNSYISK